MKPIPNHRTTPFDIGDTIVSKLDPFNRFRIINLIPCQTITPQCPHCITGNICYQVKRFKKRLGNTTKTLCPVNSRWSEYTQWEPSQEG